MHEFLVQHEKELIFLTGCIFLPCLLLTALFYVGFSERNISGLLNERQLFPLIHLAALLLLGWLDFTLTRIAGKQGNTDHLKMRLTMMSVLICLALFIPYNESPFVQTVHVVLTYAAFVYMNTVYWRLCRYDLTVRNVYLCALATAFFLCLGAGEIIGIAEVIYASACSILLSVLALK